MPRIAIIDQTTNVSTSVPTTQAQAAPVANVAAGLSENLHKAELGYINQLAQKENADAVANTGKPLSDADVYWKQYLVDTGKNTVDGGMVKQDDGTAVPMRQKAEKDFDTWSTGFMKGITNEKAKVYAQNHIMSLRTQTLDSALRYEAQAGIANRSAKVDEAVNTWASAAASDSGSTDQLILSAKTMIANSGFDEKTRNDKAVAATKQIIEAAATGAMNRDPAGFKAAALKRYGIDPTAPKPEGAPAAAPGAISLPNDPSLPAGMRNNNPGNIKYVGQAGTVGPSKNKDQGDPQAVYATPDEGMAAMFTLALKKYGGGKTTANSIIAGQGGWTPGNTAAAANIAKTMGIAPDADLNLRDPAQLKSFGRALMLQEHGQASGKYPDEMVTRVAGDVLAGRKVQPSAGAGRGFVNPPVLSGPSDANTAPPAASVAIPPAMQALVDRLPEDRLSAFISHSNTLVNQQQATVRAQVTTAEGDQVTAFMNGQTVTKPLTQAEYTAAFGPVEGPQRYANFQQIQQLGSDMTSMKAMPPAQMQQLAENYRPDANKPGYELATKRYETILKAADQINTARQGDAMAYAMQNGIGGAQPLDFNDPKKFGAELNKRQGVAATMQSTYGSPYTMLTKAEVATLSGGFDKMTTQQRLGYLETIKTSVADPAAYRSIMQQIAPDSPVTAMAGIILSKQDPMRIRNTFSADDIIYQKDVAGIMLEGEQLINPSKGAKGEDGKGKVFPMPKEQDMRDAFTNAVGKAFAADPRGADFAYQAVKAYYAGKSARTGDVSGTTDSGRLKEAITAVIGGVSDANGKGEVIRPWGMDEARFKNATQDAFSKAMATAGYAGSALDNFGAYGLQSAGDSKYMLRSGTGYLADRSGNPIVLDVTPKPYLFNQIPTGAPTPVPPVMPPATVVPEKSGKPVTTQPKTK